jgi:1-phosphatidylinositol phosphodiesterase
LRSKHDDAAPSRLSTHSTPLLPEMSEKQPLLAHNDRHDNDRILESSHVLDVEEYEGGESESLAAQSHRTAQIAGDNWMSHLPSSTLMSAITIPGTHDSAAYTYSWPFIATQTLDITAQLNAGIRYFDLRCGLRANILEMVHGQAILNLRLEEVLTDMYAWLAAHPSEALIAQIKRDRKDESSTLHFAQAMIQLLSATPDHWRTANTTPLLGELRGRIQLFRRFESSPYHPLGAYGLDVSHWQDNPERPFTIHTPQNVRLTIQDHYSFSDTLGLPALIARKGGDVSELLDLAATTFERGDPGSASQWYINFTSAFEFNLYYQITPREIAAGAYWAFRWEEGMNVRLRAYLDAHTDDRRASGQTTKRRFGIVAMDFPEAGAKDLVMGVAMTNFEQHGAKWRRWKPRLSVVVLVMCGLLFALFWLLASSMGIHRFPVLMRGDGVEIIAEQ